ncbi:MAG: glycyl-radical enzyme activating protein [Bacillota bacterium]|nr:glycyl-radical enzyme activating protein [Bacillota bacterium]
MREESGLIFDVQRFCLHDGPGIRTTVFLKGCPLRCLWCSNPESQSGVPELLHYPQQCIRCGQCLDACRYGAIQPAAGKPENSALTPVIERAACKGCGACAKVCPSGALRLAGEVMTSTQVLELVRRDLPFFQRTGGGLTLSGGEPLLQPAFVLSTLEGAQQLGVPAALETAGLCAADDLVRAGRLCEVVLFDLKHADPVKHRQLTGHGNSEILENLRLLVERGCRVTVRIPLVNGLTATVENARALSAILKEVGKAHCRAAPEGGIMGVELMPYHELGAGKYAALGRPNPLPDAMRALVGEGVTPHVSQEVVANLQRIVTEDSGFPCRAPRELRGT